MMELHERLSVLAYEEQTSACKADPGHTVELPTCLHRSELLLLVVYAQLKGV